MKRRNFFSSLLGFVAAPFVVKAIPEEKVVKVFPKVIDGKAFAQTLSGNAFTINMRCVGPGAKLEEGSCDVDLAKFKVDWNAAYTGPPKGEVKILP